MNDPHAIVVSALSGVPFAQAHTLPSQSGLYFALSVHGHPLYIGATINLRSRWISHNRKQALTEAGCVTIAYYLCDEVDLDVLEPAMIQRFNPVLNGPWYPKKKRGTGTAQRINLFISDQQLEALMTLQSVSA